MSAPDANGWIEANGDRPVGAGSRVDIKFRVGDGFGIILDQEAGSLEWSHGSGAFETAYGDIIAYRAVHHD